MSAATVQTHPVAGMLAQWEQQTGVPAFTSGTIDGQQWEYATSARDCGICGDVIPVGRVSVRAPIVADNSAMGWCHVRCVTWRHERECSYEHRAGHWHAATNRELRMRGDIGSGTPSPKAAATQLAKVDPVKAPRFSVTVCPEADRVPGYAGTKGYGKLLPLVDAVGAYVVRQDVARASGAPAPAVKPRKRSSAPKVAPSTYVTPATPEAACVEIADAMMRHAWSSYAAWWADVDRMWALVVAAANQERDAARMRAAELRDTWRHMDGRPAWWTLEPCPVTVPADVVDAAWMDMVREVVPDPLEGLTPAEVRALLWVEVSRGSLSIDDALARMEGVYALEAAGVPA